jgi:hypothetical protein
VEKIKKTIQALLSINDEEEEEEEEEDEEEEENKQHFHNGQNT